MLKQAYMCSCEGWEQNALMMISFYQQFFVFLLCPIIMSFCSFEKYRLLRFPPQRQASMDMLSATLWGLISLMGKSLKILFLHLTTVM
jgi:hypothetical protein